jgi:hypothetical protein
VIFFTTVSGGGKAKTSILGYIFKNLDLFSGIIDIIYRKICYTMPAYYVAIGHDKKRIL